MIIIWGKLFRSKHHDHAHVSIGAAKGSVGGHSSPSDAETWINSVTPAWVILSKVLLLSSTANFSHSPFADIVKVVWVVLFLQPIILGCAKLAVLFLCRRIFGYSKSFMTTSLIAIILVIGFMTAFALGLFFDCGSELSANWGSLAEIAQKCPFGFMPTIIYTILDACLDLFVLVLPLPWVRCSGSF